MLNSYKLFSTNVPENVREGSQKTSFCIPIVRHLLYAAKGWELGFKRKNRVVWKKDPPSVENCDREPPPPPPLKML